MPGIYDSVTLEIVPALRLDDVFVKPAAAAQALAIEVTVVNAGPVVQRTVPSVLIRDPDGRACAEFTGASIEVPPGANRVVSLSGSLLAPRLWSPLTPVLYRAEAALDRTAAGTVTGDQRAVTFGVRDFTAKGTDFLLNGQRQVLLRNSLLVPPGTPAERVRNLVAGELENVNCVRQHLGFINRFLLDQADASGLLVIPEFWGFYQVSNRPFPITEAAHWVPNTVETMRRVVRRYRNHPSVIMWSVTNETFWNSTKPEHLAVAEQLVAALTASDPTRLLQADAELSYDGRLPTISVHYPEGDTGTVSRTYVNSGWVVPNDLDWLKPGARNHSWRADFLWDRPLMFGEFYARDGDEPERYTAYAGDAAYDRTRWSLQDFGGRDATLPPGNPWIEMVKMSCDHYRAAGVACLNPWTGLGRQVMPRLNVAPLDHFPNAFGGEDSERRFTVQNDSAMAWNDIHLQATLVVAGREVWSERKIPASVAPGESREVLLTLRPPQVQAPTRARLVVRMCWMRGPWPSELARHEEDVFIEPRPSLAGVDATTIAVIDVPAGTTTRALSALGLRLEPGALDAAALTGKRLLIIGEGAAAGRDLSAAARFAESGGQVLVLHQTACEPFVPGQPDIDPVHAATFSWPQSATPVLAGFEAAQLRWWHPDHLVVSESLLRPSAGAASALAVSGGRYGMHWAPLAEIRHGRGAVVFCQYLLANRTAVEPAAARILCQAVRAGVAATPQSPAPALQIVAAGAKTRTMLAACHVLTAEGGDGAGPLLLDLAVEPKPEQVRQVRDQVRAGRTVWLRGLTPQTVASVADLLPWKPGFAPLDGKQVGAMVRGSHRFTAGLGHGDLYWARGNPAKATTPLGGPLVVPPALDVAVLLTEPALLVAVPVGSGWILIDQFAWDQALAAETERATRLVSCLARNAGAGFAAPSDGMRHFQITGVDLSAVANRGYFDAKPGDGVGGWTDQGDNDMRYFLCNHTGMVNGMAVAGETFPTRVTLAGVAWQLVDPPANGGRAVITLRGNATIDPASPAQVRDIPVGDRTADRLWFLHAAAWPATGGYGAVVARYEVVYADGSRAVIPVRYGQEISDWWNPMPLSGAQVAWTGRNEKSSTVGIYAMPWDNPHPALPIRTIDVISAQVGTQLTLLGISLGIDAGGARPAAQWECGNFAAGIVPAVIGGEALRGNGSPAVVGTRPGLRLTDGANLQGQLPPSPLTEGKPVAIEVEVAPEGKPGGYCGGLVEVGAYQASGLRLTLGQDQRVTVELWSGVGPTKATVFTAPEPLPSGRFSTVRFEHDGSEGRLLIDGQVRVIKACPPAAPYTGVIRIGLASGKDYWFRGVIGKIGIFALKQP